MKKLMKVEFCLHQLHCLQYFEITVDREELRADRAVNISKKELNCLIAELFEYTDIYESNKQSQKSETNQEPIVENDDNSESDKSVDSEDDPDVHIRKHQIQILAQQIRQHIQMLTHNFLLTYEHPLFSDMAFEFKDMLVRLLIL